MYFFTARRTQRFFNYLSPSFTRQCLLTRSPALLLQFGSFYVAVFIRLRDTDGQIERETQLNVLLLSKYQFTTGYICDAWKKKKRNKIKWDKYLPNARKTKKWISELEFNRQLCTWILQNGHISRAIQFVNCFPLLADIKNHRHSWMSNSKINKRRARYALKRTFAFSTDSE